MCRPTMPLVVFLLVGFSLIAGAAEIDVGDRQLTIPIPDGYAELTPAMTPYYEMMQAYIASSNYRYLSLIPKDKAEALLRGDSVEFARYMNVESEKTISTKSISADMFDEFRGVLRTQLGETVERINKALPGMIDKANSKISETFDADIAFSVGDMVPLPIHLDTPNALAYSMYLNYAGSVNGDDVAGGVVASTMLTLHVKDKVLFVYVYGAETDLEWTRGFADSWATRIIALNPISAEVKRAIERPNSQGIHWGRVFEKAAVGAVIGGLIGLLGMLFSRRKKK